MSFELKPLHPDAVAAAAAKADRYRLLNEPQEAESICLDILAIDPGNQAVLVCLLLSLTDQFGARHTVAEAQALIPRLAQEYERAYYAGIIAERWAKSELGAGRPAHAVYHWFRVALGHYQHAEPLAPDGNDDAILRWNACVRVIHANPQLAANEKEDRDTDFGDDPVR
jgi:hypothetical protein